MRFVAHAAMIAAVYVAVTQLIAPLGFGPVQARIAEALTVLPYFTPAAIPGLFIGCLISNMISPYGLIDLICGSLATLIAAICSYGLRRWKWLVPLPPIIVNALIIGAMLAYLEGAQEMLWWFVLSVGLGQVGSCYGLGCLVIITLEKYDWIFE
jgi:uncharacterized membrane protein